MHTVLIRALCVLEVIINWRCQEGICSDVIRSVNKQFQNEIQND